MVIPNRFIGEESAFASKKQIPRAAALRNDNFCNDSNRPSTPSFCFIDSLCGVEDNELLPAFSLPAGGPYPR
jgi:hypothetical protein